MHSIYIDNFKTNLPNILEEIQKTGESFVIENKKHKKIAILVPYSEDKRVRKFGQLKGKITIPDDFDSESKEINEMFYRNREFLDKNF